MRVPALSPVPNVMPQGGAPQLRVERPGGFDALQQGAASLGHATDVIQHQVEKEQHEAAVVAARDELTEYQRETTEVLHGSSKVTPGGAADAAFAGREARTGYLATRGKSAAETSADTLDELEQKRQKRAERLTNPKARELFLQSSAQAYEHTRTTIESHVGREIERAKLDSIAAATDEALRAAALDPGNDKLAAERIASVVGPLASLGRGQEFTDREALAVQQKVAAARLDALLAQGDLETAERVLDENKWALGSQLDNYRKAVGNARAGAEAEVAAGQLVSAATNEKGEVNQAAVLRRLNSLPGDQQKRLRPIVFQKMTEQEQAFAADTKRISTASFAVYNKVGWAAFRKQPLAEELNERNPELYNRLENDARMEWERHERKKRGTAEDRRWQSEQNKVALNLFLSMPPEARNELNVEEWLKGRGVDEVGASDITRAKETARQVVEKGQAAGENEFVNRAKADAEGTLPVITDAKSRGRRAAEEAKIEAEARRWYSQWVVEHAGKPPTDKDIAEKSGKIAASRVPIGEAGAAQQADVIIRRGVRPGAQVLPEMDFSGAKPSRLDRAKQLKAEGKSLEQAKLILKDEGY